MIRFNAPEPSDYDRFFSNFAVSRITFDGIEYPTVEHAYQAQKTTDEFQKRRLAEEETPGRAKRKGRLVKCRTNWDVIKFDIMVRCLMAKFQIPMYRDALLETGGAELVEDASKWNDCEWGEGRAGKGRNLLGKALMLVRHNMKHEPKNCFGCGHFVGTEDEAENTCSHPWSEYTENAKQCKSGGGCPYKRGGFSP